MGQQTVEIGWAVVENGSASGRNRVSKQKKGLSNGNKGVLIYILYTRKVE
jgi:hypothetical protein